MVLKSKIISTLIIILFLSGCTSSVNSETNLEPSAKESPTQVASNDLNINGGSYETYTSERFNELYGTEKLILFFHAGWCPTCRALEKEIKDNLPQLNGMTVLEVNYDTETELKKEYGITVQSTAVFINSNGSIFEKRLNPDFELIEKFFL